ncbi:hypothetical protein OSTOST_04879, partial [Ostertagia ostertagi]
AFQVRGATIFCSITIFSVISGRSDVLSAVGGGHSMPHLAFTESVTPQSMVFPLNIEDVEGEDALFTKKPRPISRRAPPSLCLFYSTPIVKYWLSLLFRLLHIALLAYSILLPGCGNLTLDAIVWMWTFIAWIEAVWVLNMRNHTTPLSLMPWRVFDCALTLAFLVSMLLFKFVGDSVVSDFFLLSTVYPVRVLSSFFLLYWCYATIFFYIPLSELFGPIVVRVKLMILRDFTNFLILVALVMSSSRSVQFNAVLYPDRDISVSVARSSLSWVWLSLFTTDLSSRKSLTLVKKRSWALRRLTVTMLASMGTPRARHSPQLVIFVLDLRPPLPPPLTPLFFFCMACCRAGGQLGGMMSTYPDHPDVDHRERGRSNVRFGSVYRNPSVPAKKNEFVNSFWRQLMIDRWREETQVKTADIGNADTKIIQNQLRMLALNNAYLGAERRSKSEMDWYIPVHRILISLSVPSMERSWQVLLPRYSPPFYCRPAEEFPTDAAKHVEVATE